MPDRSMRPPTDLLARRPDETTFLSTLAYIAPKYSSTTPHFHYSQRSATRCGRVRETVWLLLHWYSALSG